MTSQQGAELLAAGMVAPVGLRAAAVAAAVRAGITRLNESPVFGRHGEPLVMGLVGDEVLPPLARKLEKSVPAESRHRRMLRLAGSALKEALDGASLSEPVPLLLALPEPWPDLPDPVGDNFLAHLLVQAETKGIDLARSQLHAQGRAAGLLALQEALTLLARGRTPYVLVGGVDTYLDHPLLARMDEEGRLPTGTVTDGFIPGEGAAFLLLGAPGKSNRSGLEPLAQVLGVGTGTEPGHRYSEEPYRGEGLAEAFHALFSALPEATPPIRCVYAGLNGESFWAKEWGVAWLRNSKRFAEGCRVEHPVQSFGDAGAALGPLMLGLTAVGLQRGHLEGPCLVWCSSDREERGAALLHTA